MGERSTSLIRRDDDLAKWGTKQKYDTCVLWVSVYW